MNSHCAGSKPAFTCDISHQINLIVLGGFWAKSGKFKDGTFPRSHERTAETSQQQ